MLMVAVAALVGAGQARSSTGPAPALLLATAAADDRLGLQYLVLAPRFIDWGPR